MELSCDDASAIVRPLLLIRVVAIVRCAIVFAVAAGRQLCECP